MSAYSTIIRSPGSAGFGMVGGQMGSPGFSSVGTPGLGGWTAQMQVPRGFGGVIAIPPPPPPPGPPPLPGFQPSPVVPQSPPQQQYQMQHQQQTVSPVSPQQPQYQQTAVSPVGGI